jgi:hypothetical protein
MLKVIEKIKYNLFPGRVVFMEEMQPLEQKFFDGNETYPVVQIAVKYANGKTGVKLFLGAEIATRKNKFIKRQIKKAEISPDEKPKIIVTKTEIPDDKDIFRAEMKYQNFGYVRMFDSLKSVWEFCNMLPPQNTK